MNRWRKFIESEFTIEDAEVVKPKHIKQYILHAQNLGIKKAITINNSLVITFLKRRLNTDRIDKSSRDSVEIFAAGSNIP